MYASTVLLNLTQLQEHYSNISATLDTGYKWNVYKTFRRSPYTSVLRAFFRLLVLRFAIEVVDLQL